MGIRITGASEEDASVSPSSLRGALLLATVCIVGLPVEVHIKDGSIYSGIFHTASADEGYGVVLKKAMMVKRGTRASNIANEVVIDTLVVLPGDLVQVVAKDVMLSANGISADVLCDTTGSADNTNPKASLQHLEGEEVSADLQVDKEHLKMNQKRQVGDCRLRGEDNGFHCSSEDEPVCGTEGPSTEMNGYNLQRGELVENHSLEELKQLPNGIPEENSAAPDAKSIFNGHGTLLKTGPPGEDVVNPSVPKPLKPVGDAISDKSHGSSAELVPTQYRVAKKGVRESKLNPGAKIFAPSSIIVRSVAPPVVPTVPSMSHVPNKFPVLPCTVPQPEVAIRPSAPRSSWPAKFSLHGNFTIANSGSGLQYAQHVPMVGHIASRTQPIRYNGQYQAVQAGVPYVLTNPASLSQGMVGRVGQLVYVQSASPDMAEAVVPYASLPLLTPHQIHIPDHDGLVIAQPPPQLSLTPSPLMANMRQPFPIPNHVQLSQPQFSTIRPITILGSSGPYNVKFP